MSNIEIFRQDNFEYWWDESCQAYRGNWITTGKDDDYRKSYIVAPVSKSKPPKSTNIYIMRNNRNGYIKIGRSVRPLFREKTLQSEDPDISLILFFEATTAIERELHQKFSEQRVRGEWFRLGDESIEWIRIAFSSEVVRET